jgi:hypothetical protein
MNAATTQGLVHYSAARVALEKAHAIDEVKAIKDKAEAMRVYAAQANDVEMQNMCVEIKLRAQRKIGQMLIDMNPRPGRIGHNGGTNSPLPDEVTRNQSSQWQKLAAIPDDVFERVVVETVEKTGELTQAAVLREVVLGPIREAKERELLRSWTSSRSPAKWVGTWPSTSPITRTFFCGRRRSTCQPASI